MANESLPNEMDDIPAHDDRSEADLLDAVLRSSEILGLPAEEPLPEQEYTDEDPANSIEEDDREEIEEVVSDEADEEETEEVEGEDADEEESESATEEPTAYSVDDLDEDFKIKVPFQGEEFEVSIADLVKSYGTEQSHSKKGRELGEAKKAFEQEREAQLAEIQGMGKAAAASLYKDEQALSKQYHDLESKIEKAREEGDTYEVNELKDKRELIQKKYWEARRGREGLLEGIKRHEAEQAHTRWQQQMSHFQETIHEYVPDFDEKVASDIREFALNEGLPEEVVDSIMDPRVVKMLDDYRRLKTTSSKGAAKRKVVPAKKAVPLKKSATKAEKQKKQEDMIKARAFREDATDEDQMAFLRKYASESGVL